MCQRKVALLSLSMISKPCESFMIKYFQKLIRLAKNTKRTVNHDVDMVMSICIDVSLITHQTRS